MKTETWQAIYTYLKKQTGLCALYREEQAFTKSKGTYWVKKIEDISSLPGHVRIPANACVYAAFVCTKAISWAAAVPKEGGFSTIVAETIPAYRGRGAATACLMSLLENETGPFLYLCQKENSASLRLAQKAGFTPL